MKIFRLIYNELVKQFKKPSTNIIIALILVSAIIVPIVFNKINIVVYNDFRGESIEYLIKQADRDLKNMESDSTQKGKIQKAYLEIDKSYNQLLLENKIGYDDWRKLEADNYNIAAYNLAAIEFVLEGFSKELVIEQARSVDINEVAKYYDLTLAKKKEVEAKYTQELAELKKIIDTNDYKRHSELEIERIKSYIAREQGYINEYEKLAEKNPTDKENKDKLEVLKKQKESALESILKFEQDLAILQFRYDNDIDYSKSNWKNNSIVEVQKILLDYRMKMYDKNQYSLMGDRSLAKTYEEYVENYTKANNVRVERMKEIWYGLENNIPDLGSVKDARSIIDSTYEIYVILAVVVAIIIGGGIVAGEFSTGSIRLLLIRPVARWKVLLAKLLAVLIVGFAVVILGTTILVITSGVVFGFETLKVPVLQTVNSNIVQLDYLKYMIPQLVMSTASLVFITSVVFMISTLARNTALSVAVGMLLYIGVAPLSDLLISFKETWLINTLFPYINGSYFKLNPNIKSVLAESGITMNYASGATQLIIVSLVVLVITFAVFVKRDVKN